MSGQSRIAVTLLVVISAFVLNVQLAQAQDDVVAAGITPSAVVGEAAKATPPVTVPTGPTTAEGPTAQRLSLALGGDYRYHGRNYVLPRALVELKGKVKTYVAGQTLAVTIKRGKRVVLRKDVSFEKLHDAGVFTLKFRAGASGSYSFHVEHLDSAELTLSSTHSVKLKVVSTDISRGSRGVSVQLIQQKLAALKFVVPRSGKFDDATGRALLAFRKTNGLSRIERAGYRVGKKLALGQGAFKLKYPKAGRHVEVDLSRQVMAFADNGKVERVYHVSSGKPSTPTVQGTFHFYLKSWGTNQKGMVNSSYFIRGYAVHGYSSVPNYAASHGCIRVPVPNAASIFRWIRSGDRIDVYR